MKNMLFVCECVRESDMCVCVCVCVCVLLFLWNEEGIRLMNMKKMETARKKYNV